VYVNSGAKGVWGVFETLGVSKTPQLFSQTWGSGQIGPLAEQNEQCYTLYQVKKQKVCLEKEMYEISGNLAETPQPAQEDGGEDPARSLAGLQKLQHNTFWYFHEA